MNVAGPAAAGSWFLAAKAAFDVTIGLWNGATVVDQEAQLRHREASNLGQGIAAPVAAIGSGPPLPAELSQRWSWWGVALCWFLRLLCRAVLTLALPRSAVLVNSWQWLP